jgi:hypothetical protein
MRLFPLAVVAALVACSSPAESPPPPIAAPPTAASTPTPTPPAPPSDPTEDIVQSHHDGVEACARTAHAAAPTLAGTVEVRWDVLGTGNVVHVTLGASTLSAPDTADGGEPARALEQCILADVGTYTYPAMDMDHSAAAHHVWTIGEAPPVVHVRTGDATVSPGLAPEVVRRVIRRHINEVRYCYEQALADAPTMAGSLVVHFGIDAAGETTAPTLASSAMVMDGAPDGGPLARQVEACVLTAVDRWVFPAPEGGPITVDFPFTLSSEPPSPRPPGEIGTLGHGAGYGIGS